MIYAIWNKGNQVVLLKETIGQVALVGDALSFLENWCLEAGSTIQGRQEATRYILHVTQKVPVLINERTMDLLFPTRSPKDIQCIWLNYRSIVKYQRKGNGTHFEFRDGQTLYIEEDIRIFHREMKLCKTYFEHFMSV